MPLRRLLPYAYAAVLAAAYVLVFVVPWHVSPGMPANSDSFAIGFSNRASLLGALLAAVALFALGFVDRTRVRVPAVRSSRPERGEGVPGWLIALLLVVAVVSAVAFAWIGFRVWTYGEKNYFLDRLMYVINGNVPYRDMEFTYGPLLAYLPALAWRALRPLGVSPVAAYETVYVVLFAAGVPLLAYCVNRLELTRRRRAWLFAALGAAVAINETVGINGLLVRFLLPAAAVLFFHARATAALRREGRPAALALGGWALVAVVACMAMSPELGIACFIALAAYLGWVALALRRREALWAALALVAAPALVLAAVGPALVTHLLGMASGALNFPVVPSPAVLVVLGATFAAAALLPRFLSAEEPASPALLGLAAAAAVMLAGGLGRADTSHLYFYSLAAVLLAAPLLAATHPRVFAVGALAFGVVFVAAHALILHYDYAGAVVNAATGTQAISRRTAGGVAFVVGLPRRSGWITWDRMTAGKNSTRPGADAYAAYQPLAAPFGFMDATGLELAQRGWLASPYFRGVPFTPEQLATMETYVGRADHLIIEKSVAASLSTTVAPAGTGRLGTKYLGELMWPQTFPVRNARPNLAGELGAFIARRYRVVAELGRYAVLERKE